jgi:non-heme chloroperoxidase
MLAGVTGVMDCIKAFSETDFTEDLKTFDVPIGASALVSSTIIKNATLKVYPSAPHGLTNTHKDQLNTDLLAFLKA